MKESLFIKNGIVICESELVITASKAGGPGGQHANKANTRVTVSWNVYRTNALTSEQKDLVVKKLQAQISNDGDLVIHKSSSRSQLQNKKEALQALAQKIKKALYVSKKRMKTRVPKAAVDARLTKKKKQSDIKKGRRSIFDF